jgi:organic radical activating enzyme
MGRVYLIPVKYACNADCTFCITEREKLQPAFAALGEYLPADRLREVLQPLPEEVTEIEVTGGGEPFLHPKLPEILEQIRSWRPSVKIKLYTNGFLLRPIPPVDELNISRCHDDTARNQEVYRGRRPTDLEAAARFFRPFAESIRLQVPLMRGYIDSPQAAEAMIGRCRSFIDGFVFRPLFPSVALEQDKAVRFAFTHPLAKMDDLQPDYCGSRPVIGSSGVLYRDWTFTQPMDPEELRDSLRAFRKPN